MRRNNGEFLCRFRPSISRKSGRKKFHEKLATNSAGREIKFFQCETLGVWGHKKSRDFRDKRKQCCIAILGCDEKSLAICDFGLRFMSPKPLLSAEFLAIWLRQRGNRERLRWCDFGALRSAHNKSHRHLFGERCLSWLALSTLAEPNEAKIISPQRSSLQLSRSQEGSS